MMAWFRVCMLDSQGPHDPIRSSHDPILGATHKPLTIKHLRRSSESCNLAERKSVRPGAKMSGAVWIRGRWSQKKQSFFSAVHARGFRGMGADHFRIRLEPLSDAVA